MNKNLFAVLVFLFFFLTLPLLCSGERLTILHTNDTHSHLFSFGPNNSYGGIARMSTLIKDLKTNNGNVLALHSGDAFVGTFAFNKYLGYPELKIMEGLYDAMCLGNHEFDLGPDILTGILAGSFSGGIPISLPLLCANVDLTEYPFLDPFVDPYRVIVVGGIKVGLIGVVTTDEFNYSEEVNAILTDPYTAAGEAAWFLRYIEGCDLIICLSHLGRIIDELGLSTVPNIDIIIGGHSHDLVEAEIVNGKIIVQAGEYGKHLGELTVDIDTEPDIENGGVTLVGHELYSIDKKVIKDPVLLGTLNNLRDGIYQDPRFGPVYSKYAAKALWDLEERWEEENPNRDTPLGNLVADAIRFGIKNSGIQLPYDYPLIAIEANGNIGHKTYEGKVVGNDVLRSVPYGYDPESGLGFKVKIVILAGLEILGGLEYSVSVAEYTDEISLQVSGLEFKYDSRNDPFDPDNPRVDPTSVMVNGEPIDLNYPTQRLYYVALNERLIGFLEALGVDLTGRIIEPSPSIFEYNLVRDFMHQLNHLAYTSEGRIIDRAFE